ncbi:hypothetical protein MG293_002510 [Ovis ammon polii]|uniref:Tetraspanin n=1 Tax=Ovis ammon polii TaxID=230172 RepID=A0AAD4UL10_OVIAM|nr:hypothetical protein MG293_002510 [Ovis ammon polii]KAI4576208.1 hypothetical protein MJT46_002043 [Ovis ammon polii x Ovis aries]
MKSSLEIEAVVFLTPGGTDPTSEGVDHSPVLASGQKKPHQEAMERSWEACQLSANSVFPDPAVQQTGNRAPRGQVLRDHEVAPSDPLLPASNLTESFAEEWPRLGPVTCRLAHHAWNLVGAPRGCVKAPELEINHRAVALEEIIWVGPVPVTERGQGGGGRARVDSGGNWGEGDRGPAAMAHYKVEQDDWLTVYLKYLLFVFNFFFWVGGAAVMAVGVWTLVEKSGYLGVLASSTFAASAYILIFAGALVMLTGFLGFGAIIREDRGCLSAYFCLLLAIFLVELVAGVLAHVYYQRLSDELKQHLTHTLAENYMQPGAAEITASVDRLQQDFKCCGSNSSADWLQSSYILSPEAEGRRVPDSCCKTVVARCGQRAHPSNIYKVEGGCISKLEQFLADHLLLMGAVGIGVACLQPPPRVLSKVEGVDSGGADAFHGGPPLCSASTPDTPLQVPPRVPGSPVSGGLLDPAAHWRGVITTFWKRKSRLFAQRGIAPA